MSDVREIEQAVGGAETSDSTDPFRLDRDDAYRIWRKEKLAANATLQDAPVIGIDDPRHLSGAERQAILESCRTVNMVIYEAPALAGDPEASREAVAAMVRTLGLRQFENHRSGAKDGIVAIEVADRGGRAGFIPYTNRAINWHTDGYYSYRSPQRMIRSMVLHCARDAAEGGESGLLDPDIAYIRLRDEDPAFIEALMHAHAMTIPAFDDEKGKSHDAVAGPVFVVADGQLAMRFTIRKRNIEWRDDEVLTAAREKLAQVLADDPLIVRRRLQPNQGIVCNNVLHARKSFTNKDGQAGRLFYRVRSYDRIGAAGI